MLGFRAASDSAASPFSNDKREPPRANCPHGTVKVRGATVDHSRSRDQCGVNLFEILSLLHEVLGFNRKLLS